MGILKIYFFVRHEVTAIWHIIFHHRLYMIAYFFIEILNGVCQNGSNPSQILKPSPALMHTAQHADLSALVLDLVHELHPTLSCLHVLGTEQRV